MVLGKFSQGLAELKIFIKGIIKNLLLLSIVSLALCGVVLYLAQRSQFFVHMEEWRNNSIGPFEQLGYAIIFILLVATIVSKHQWLLYLIKTRAFTWLDFLAFTVLSGWLLIIIVYDLNSVILNNINWTRLNYIKLWFIVLWWSALAWILVRIVCIFLKGIINKTPSAGPLLLLDEPIGLNPVDQDLLNRRHIISLLANMIQHGQVDGPLGIAITGRWGEGKTSTVNLALRLVESQASKKPIIIRFDPWYFNNGVSDNFDVLLRNFLKELRNKLAPHIPSVDLAKLFTRYYKILAPALISIPTIDQIFEFEEPTVLFIKSQIKNAVESLDQRVVVVIDDLDRMDGHEIAFILKLVRLCTDFDNFVYVVLYDSSYLESQLKTVFQEYSRDYLQKIFQIEISLPQVERLSLAKIFSYYFRELDESNRTELIKEIDLVASIERILPHIVELLGNVRQIKRFLNRFFLVLLPIRNDINPFDLLILELVRIKHPEIHEIIYQNPQHFTFSGNENMGNNEHKEFFEDILNNYKCHPSIFTLLAEVFGSVKNYVTKKPVSGWHTLSYLEGKSASYPSFFYSYFYLDLPSNELPEVERVRFIKEINSSDDIEKIVKVWLDYLSDHGWLSSWLFQMLHYTHEIVRNRILAFTMALSNNSKIFLIEPYEDEKNKKGIDSLSLFPTGDCGRLIHLIIGLLSLLPNDERETALMSLAKESTEIIIPYLIIPFVLVDSSLQTQKLLRKGAPERYHSSLPNKEVFLEIIYKRVKERFLTGSDNLLQIENQFRRDYLNLLTESSSEKVVRQHVDVLLEMDNQNYLNIINTVTYIGYDQYGKYLLETPLTVETHIVIDYRQLKIFIEPSILLQKIEQLSLVNKMTKKQMQVFNRLRDEIIEGEAEEEQNFLYIRG